ncbi:hypothetical protein [Virgibacillus sp. L01]|uniref:hypothetical protein n=1 Tax=Virgibacillus sp. L01 TaxID=3457429 RepID=UPI003FD54A5D
MEKAGDKLSEEKLKEMLDAETWLSADETLQYGLCNVVLDANDMAASISDELFAKYKNVPEALVKETEDPTGPSKEEMEQRDVELVKIKNINEVIKQGPLKIELINAKILKRTNLSQEFINFIRQFSQVNEKEVSYLQLRYNVENTSDEDVAWMDLMDIVTDEQE